MLTHMFSQINQRFGQWLSKRAGNADEFVRVEIVGDAIELHAVSGGTTTRVLLAHIKRIDVADVSAGVVDVRAAWFELTDGNLLSINAETTGWVTLWDALPAHLPITRDVCTSVLLSAEPELGVVFVRGA
jgi:hypothetical protein